jgi:hypothetical protein
MSAQPSTAASPTSAEEKMVIRVIKLRGKEFYVAPSRDSPDTTYDIFDRRDRYLEKPIGVIYVNPAAATLSFSSYQFTDPAYLA